MEDESVGMNLATEIARHGIVSSSPVLRERPDWEYEADEAAADQQLDAFIERRCAENQRTRDAHLNPPRMDEAEEIWKESERRHEQARLEQLKAARVEFHEAMARRHQTVLTSLIERHRAEAERWRNHRIEVA